MTGISDGGQLRLIQVELRAGTQTAGQLIYSIARQPSNCFIQKLEPFRSGLSTEQITAQSQAAERDNGELTLSEMRTRRSAAAETAGVTTRSMTAIDRLTLTIIRLT